MEKEVIKQIRGISSLPKWFDVNKYNETKKFNIKNWYVNLFFRRQIIDDFLFSHSLPDKAKDEKKKQIKNMYESLKKDPIIKKNALVLFPEIVSEFDFDEEAKKIKDTNHFYQKVTFCINMDMPIKVIIDELSKKIQKYKKEHKIKKQRFYSTAVLKTFSRNQILPYIDLCLWGFFDASSVFDIDENTLLLPKKWITERIRENIVHLEKYSSEKDTERMIKEAIEKSNQDLIKLKNKKDLITNNVFAHALFSNDPNASKGEDTIRKMTSIDAVRLMTSRDLNDLGVQAVNS